MPKTDGNEIFPIVDENGNVTGKATRRECHSGSFLLHPVVHLHVFDKNGRLLLQKRSMQKDIQPGKWDTSVGGHIDYFETVEQALRRESAEELGILDFEPVEFGKYVFKSKVERELINSFYTIYDGEIKFDEDEISECKFWELAEIEANLGKEVFTPNFESEFERFVRGCTQVSLSV